VTEAIKKHTQTRDRSLNFECPKPSVLSHIRIAIGLACVVWCVCVRERGCVCKGVRVRVRVCVGVRGCEGVCVEGGFGHTFTFIYFACCSSLTNTSSVQNSAVTTN
jgi:hypothetical protein